MNLGAFSVSLAVSDLTAMQPKYVPTPFCNNAPLLNESRSR